MASSYYVTKTKDRLDTIHPQLCTSQEACQILGLTRVGIGNYLRKGLRYALVIHNGHRIRVYNRKEVISFIPTPPPENHITTADLIALARKTSKIKIAPSQIIYHLKRHYSIHPVQTNNTTKLYWPKDTAIPATISLAKNLKHKRDIKKQYKFKCPKPKTKKPRNNFA